MTNAFSLTGGSKLSGSLNKSARQSAAQTRVIERMRERGENPMNLELPKSGQADPKSLVIKRGKK